MILYKAIANFAKKKIIISIFSAWTKPYLSVPKIVTIACHVDFGLDSTNRLHSRGFNKVLQERFKL